MSKEGSESPRGGMMEKMVPVLLVLSIGMAFLVGVLWQKVTGLEKGGTGTTTVAGGQQPPPEPKVDLATVKGIFDKDVVKFGNSEKKVLFLEVGDPSCPYCHIADGNNPELAAQVGAQFKYKSDGGTYIPPLTEMRKLVDAGKASYAYIYFPGHGNGEMAAKALFCANDQGKFWAVHDVLYTNKAYDFINNTVKNDKAKTPELVEFIGSAADGNRLAECLNSGKYDAKIAEDQALASTLGVQGTPGFYVNDTSFSGAYNWTDMKTVVDSALK